MMVMMVEFRWRGLRRIDGQVFDYVNYVSHRTEFNEVV